MAHLAISLATKLIEVVGSTVFHEACSTWGYKSQIDELKETITTVRHVLLDAESEDGQLCHETQDYIRKLKNAVYEADDLFDEFLTLAQLKQHNKGGKLSEKVRDFFSPQRNSLSVAYSMSREVKKIRKKLDSIASNHSKFKFSGVDSQPIRNRREETCSYVYKDEVIGREDDVKKVVHMLLDSSYEERVSFLSIVGIGGLGKTTLAQLVFNDDQVKSEFPLRLWTCVSDEKQQDFDVKKILTNILESTSSEKLDGLTMDLIQSKLRGLLGGKKFLIVLDDLWNEDRNKWLGLKRFLMVGQIESRVLVTTRSKRTAIVVGDDFDKSIYELKGLSPEDSWRLFEMTAFGGKCKGTHLMNFSELVQLGKEIVEKCSYVPLAIRVVGTLLYGQNESKWRSFREYGLAKLNNGENEIMSILKLSYDNLESHLKACFTYCSLFPKDFRIKKEKLIRLWMAQGYILPFDVGQSLEDAAEEHFSILLRRCFFQEVHVNEFGGVYSFKIHDLIHDLAQKLVGNEILSLNSTYSDLGDDVHHIFDLESRPEGGFFPKCKIRTYVRDDFKYNNFPVVNLVESWKFLRTLDLHKLDIQVLPKSIGELLHLRYLDLSQNRRLARLPDSITNLYNLQTLDLCMCTGLLELPIDLAKLVNLRYLNIGKCFKLSCMPSGLDKLSCLCVLTDFVVGDGKGSWGDLESVLALTNLRGSLEIQIKGDFSIAKESDKIEERYLGKMKHLKTIILSFRSAENQEYLLERLEPPYSVKALQLQGYKGSTLPKNWYGVEGNLATLLPNLIRVKLIECFNLVHLPSLSKLVHLKSLKLCSLHELEYIEDTTDALPVFPSLEYLELSYMKNLKGWWKREDVTCNVWQPSFIKLSELSIYKCGNLTSFPNCPNLEKLESRGVNKELLMCLGKEEGLIKLKEVEIDNLDYLKTMPKESLTSLCICDKKVESFAEHGETLFMNCSSLRNLEIESCPYLRSLNGGGLEHLTSLESLTLVKLPKLVLSGPEWNADSNDDDDEDNDNDNNDDDAILWRSLEGSLKSLTFNDLEIKTLPKGLRYLTSLQNLGITGCEKLECLPDWISCLSSLRSLRINGCDALKSLPSNVRDLASLQFLGVWNCPLLAERIQDRDGDDWLNVRHIATVDIGGADICFPVCFPV